MRDQSLWHARADARRWEADRLEADADSLAAFTDLGVPNPVVLDREGLGLQAQRQEVERLRTKADLLRRSAVLIERTKMGGAR